MPLLQILHEKCNNSVNFTQSDWRFAIDRRGDTESTTTSLRKYLLILIFVIFLFQRYLFFFLPNASGLYSWYFFYNLFLSFFFYNKFHRIPQFLFTEIFYVPKIISCLDCCISMHMQETDCEKWQFATFHAADARSAMKSLRIWPASCVTFNARLTSTRPS